MTSRFRVRIAAAFAVFALLTTGVASVQTWASPNKYPTAAEVEAAKHNVAKKKALIKRIDSLIASLATDEAALSMIAQQKGEVYNQAQVQVDEVAAKVKILQGQADTANAQANAAKRQLGLIAAQMYRQGTAGTSLNLLLNAGKADDLLYQLGAQERVAQSSDTIYQRSVQTQKFAEALNSQLKVAKANLAAKAAVARAAFDEAQRAADELTAKINDNKTHMAVMVTQLATLQRTSEKLAAERAAGLAQDAAWSQGHADMTAPELYSVGSPDSAKVEIAIAYAKKQLGEPYVLGGMGPNVWDCSGITKAAYAVAGFYIGTHSATNQFREMARQQKLIPLSEIQRGDLLWYSPEPGVFDGDKAHVVIYLGNDLMLEAPHPGSEVRIVNVRHGEQLFRYAGRPTA
jgi:cell wall-associated NlpC family hydrolase